MDYYELIDILHKNQTQTLSKLLESTKVHELEYDDEFKTYFPLALMAIRYQSKELWEYLKKHSYEMNQRDEYGMTTYNYIQLYCNSDSFDYFMDDTINRDDNLDIAYSTLFKARKNIIKAKAKTDFFKAHNFTSDNYQMLFAKQECVCIYCKQRFQSNEILDYTYSNKGTALCPYCEIDSVIGEYCGYELSEEFINKMYKIFFNI